VNLILGTLRHDIRNMTSKMGLAGSVSFYFARSKLLTAVNLKIAVIQDVKPCTQVDHYKCSAVTLVTIYQITRYHNQEDSYCLITCSLCNATVSRSYYTPLNDRMSSEKLIGMWKKGVMA
jgi:hypothetical protein